MQFGDSLIQHAHVEHIYSGLAGLQKRGLLLSQPRFFLFQSAVFGSVIISKTNILRIIWTNSSGQIKSGRVCRGDGIEPCKALLFRYIHARRRLACLLGGQEMIVSLVNHFDVFLAA